MDFENLKGEKLEVLHKELDLIQSVVTRMAQNSFYMKGWCITLVAAVFSLSDATTREHVCLPLFLITVAFWAIDSYYLRQERAYRKLYCHVLQNRIMLDRWLNLYSLDARKMLKCVPCVPRIMVSISEWPLYVTLSALLLLLGWGDVCSFSEKVVRVGRCVVECASNACEVTRADPISRNVDDWGYLQLSNGLLLRSEKKAAYWEGREKSRQHSEIHAVKECVDGIKK